MDDYQGSILFISPELLMKVIVVRVGTDGEFQLSLVPTTKSKSREKHMVLVERECEQQEKGASVRCNKIALIAPRCLLR